MEDVSFDEKEEDDSFLTSEDPIREFMSERLKRASDFFFKDNINVVAIGDSLTAGSGDETENGGYVGILDEIINDKSKIVQFENLGRPGNRSGQLIERLNEENDVQNSIEKAHVVLITIGANDIMQVFKDNFTDLQLDAFTGEQIKYEQRLETMLDTMFSMNEDAEIFLIGFYNPFKQFFPDIEELDYIVESWNTIGSNVTDKYDQAQFIPMMDVFDGAEDVYYLAEDNFHPNNTGYKMMAERILQSIMDEGEASDETE